MARRPGGGLTADGPARARADDLLDRAPCGLLSTSADGTVQWANATFLRWTRRPVEHVVGRRLADLLTPGGKIFHETHYAPMLRMQGSVHEIALDLDCGDGARLPVLLNATVDDGSPEGSVSVAVFDASERRRYEQDLLRARDEARAAEDRARALARTLQETLLPPVPPQLHGLRVAAAYRPAGDGTEVGGDFYDVFSTGPDEHVVVLGDVSGKGVEAAVVTSLVRNTVRALAVLHHRPSDVLRELNEVVRTHETERFCTIVLLRLRRADRGAWQVTIGTGGHPPPIVLRPTGPVELDAWGPLVGILGGREYDEADLRLLPGEALVVYTDGVTEARGSHDYFGDDRLLAALNRYGPSDVGALVRGLTEEVVDFQDGVTRDDVAIVALSPTGD
ncbi:SpoIIE family protein phosphatase [Nocardioides sp. SYSU DS0663]|uniref:PP2C family protein-serine/threonine phosphatase n=1 Tax=Nocardioides sp. SYSU DS0663 TaxID=3416445 RepID=UPI003F4B2DF4